jgi:hypothetical protein
MGLERPNSSSVLVLNAKGEEIKAKATRSATTCELFKVFSVRILHYKICSLMGEKFYYGKRESFWCLKLVLKDIFDLPKQVFFT